MRSLFLLAICLTVVPLAAAQQSLFQSSDGQSAVYLRQSAATFNLGDSKASIGYVHRVNIIKPFWGFEAYATSNTGVTSLFSSDKPKAPEGGGDFTFGRHYFFVPMPQAGKPDGHEDWGLIDVGYGRSYFYLYPAGGTPMAKTSKTSFDRFRALIAYNYFTSGNLIAGIAAGAERRNNLTDLTSVTLETVIVPGTTGSQSSIDQSQAGYYGRYREYISAPIYTDILFYPGQWSVPGFGNRIGIDFLSRSDVAAPNRSSSGGFGIFMFKKEDPLAPIGGISASFNGTKVQVALTVGFAFPKS